MSIRDLPSFHKLATVLVVLLASQARHASASNKPDFIIIGAGTAGCALAGRLCTALPHANIVLFERAPPRNATEELYVRAARLVLDAWGIPSLTRSILTEPSEGINGRALYSPTGGTLGGSSAINAGLFVLPPNGTFDAWGVSGLSDARAIHLFKHRISPTLGLNILGEDLTPAFTSDFIEAAERVGFRVSSASMRTPANAVWPSLGHFDPSGRRVDSYTGYVAPVLKTACARNLRLVQGAVVEKILVRKKCGDQAEGRACPRQKRYSSTAPCAYGIRFSKGGKAKFMQAKREVILAGGPYESAKLLQLSGIGPKKLLRKHRIRTVVDLPVGRECQGRALVPVVSRYSVPLAYNNNGSIVITPNSLLKFAEGKGGPLGFPPAGATGHSYGNAEFVFQSGLGLGSPLIDKPMIESLCFGNPSESSFSQVSIRDRDVEKPVRIDLNLLSHQLDVDRVGRCVQHLRTIHKEMKNSIGTEEVLPEGFTSEMLDSTQGMEKYIRARAGTVHFVGCNAVGKVVNSWLGVKGIRGLRVVDASVVPGIPPSAGPMSSVYVLAEHAASLIIKVHKCLS